MFSNNKVVNKKLKMLNTYRHTYAGRVELARV